MYINKHHQVIKTIPIKTIENAIAKALGDKAGIEYKVDINDIEYLDSPSLNKAKITITLDKEFKRDLLA